MNLSPKTRQLLALVGGVACLLGAWILVGIFAGRWKETPPTSVAGPALSLKDAPTPTAPPTELVVYLTGAVRHPGVFSVPLGSRLVTVVEKAGGLAPEAAAEEINLAQPVTDGAHLHIPRRGDRERLAALAAPRASGPGPAPGSPPGALRSPTEGLVNVNTASAEELEKLPGIGPKGAQALVEDREKNGPYRAVDDLLRVKGIGPKKLEALRPLVTTGL